MSARLEVLGDDGEWHEVEGVRSVELVEEEPADLDDAVLVSVRDFALMQIDEYERRLNAPVLGRIPDRPRRARPAWQSPYGPPPRRH
ncbi:hypothetical protein ACFUVV_01020 [Streptomyces sp. NPDC057376]|uniref:hypothetical protein n=1 Tax=Streptomyces sp. NPDC057376 TaxID=3346110 RepID=UPI003641771D